MASNPQQGPSRSRKSDNRKYPQANSNPNPHPNQNSNSRPHPHPHPKNKFPPRYVKNNQQGEQRKKNDFVIVNKSDFNNPTTSGASTTDQVLKDVMNTLDCPVCFEYLRAPIFLCESGHDICGKCRSKLCLPICPLCKTTITNQRNFRLEEISEKMASPCENSVHGCTFLGSRDEVKSHYEECQFKRCFCPLGKEFKQCLWNGNISQLQMHFSEVHPNNMRLKPGNPVTFNNFNILKPDENVQLIGMGKSLYIYHVRIDPNRNLALWGVKYLGVQKITDVSNYEFHFYNPKMPKKITTLSEYCQPDSMSIEEIYNSGHCIAIPLHILKNYIHDNKLTFKFFIRKPFGNSKEQSKNVSSEVASNDEVSSLSAIADLLL